MAPQSSSRPLPPSTNGRLVATVLSAYDLPDDVQPTCVYLRALGSEVRTGPPAARHRDKNSFKFASIAGVGSSAPADRVSASNELVVSAPLPALYPSKVTFRVTYPQRESGTPTGDLEATCVLKDCLRINETQWLILNLSPAGEGDGGGADGEKKENGVEGEASGAATGGEHPPTLRLKMRLEGPFRPEVSAIVGVTTTWFRTVDGVTDAADSTTRSLFSGLADRAPALKLLLIPAVPLAGLGVALLPVAAGVLVVGLPFFLPLLVVLVAFAALVGAVAGAVYASSRDGRARIGPFVSPVYSTFASTPAGQRVLFETGPRPTPSALARAILPDGIAGKLIISLVVDLIGSSSYLLPLAGEGFDLFWAPIQAVLVAAMYDEVSPSLKYVAFAEEILPFTDFIPSATYGWLREFGPGFFDEGKKQVNDLTVAVRGEREALRRSTQL